MRLLALTLEKRAIILAQLEEPPNGLAELRAVLMLALASLAAAADRKDVTGPGQYGDVYINSKSEGGKTLDQVAFGFTSNGDVQGGAPRFSLPIR